MNECIGCGFCCFMEICHAAKKLYGEDIVDCPELIFRDGRYWCLLMEKKPHLLKDIIGIGCGAPWNRWRKDVKERSREEYVEYYENNVLVDLVLSYDPRNKKKKNR